MRKAISRGKREDQINDLLSDTNYNFVSWTDGFKNNKSRITLNCPSHGEWSTGFTNVMKGTRCAKCSVESRTLKQFEIIQYVKLNAPKRVTFSRFVNEYRNNLDKLILNCSLHGEYTVSVLHMMNSGCWCKKCGRNRVTTAKRSDTNVVVNKLLSLSNFDGYKFKGFVNNRVNCKSKVVMKCPEHGNWTPSIDDFINAGSRCPGCAKHGYDGNSKGYLYALRSTCGNHVKVGVTNNITKRLKELKWCTPFGFEHIELLSFEKGNYAMLIEKAFHDNFESSNMKGFNGATEWLKWSRNITVWFRVLNS